MKTYFELRKTVRWPTSSYSRRTTALGGAYAYLCGEWSKWTKDRSRPVMSHSSLVEWDQRRTNAAFNNKATRQLLCLARNYVGTSTYKGKWTMKEGYSCCQVALFFYWCMNVHVLFCSIQIKVSSSCHLFSFPHTWVMV